MGPTPLRRHRLISTNGRLTALFRSLLSSGPGGMQMEATTHTHRDASCSACCPIKKVSTHLLMDAITEHGTVANRCPRYISDLVADCRVPPCTDYDIHFYRGERTPGKGIPSAREPGATTGGAIEPRVSPSGSNILSCDMMTLMICTRTRRWARRLFNSPLLLSLFR